MYYNKYHNNTNWSDIIHRNSTTQSYNVTVNGGDDIALYNLSVGLTNALSTLKKNDFNRVNARFNSDINLSDRLSTVFDISYVNVNRELRNDGIAEVNNSQINSPGYLSLIKSPFLSPYQYDNARKITTKLEDYDFLNIANPYAILEYGTGFFQQTNFNLSVAPTYKLNKNLKLSSHFSYSLNNISEKMFSPMAGVAPYVDEDIDMISYNYVKTQFAYQTSISNNTKVNWKKSLNEHDYELNAGMRYTYNLFRSEYGEGHNTGNDQVRDMSGGLQYKKVDGIYDPYKLLTYYGVFDYAFKDKYFAEAAFAFETNSRFGSKATSGVNMLGVSWGLFPSINAAWLISSERFMRNLKFINQLKLRAGIGTSGNDGIETTAAHTYFNAVQSSNKATGLELHNIANPAIQWETVVKRNLGLDANVLNNRLSLSLDVYHNTTTNLLVLKNLESISGIKNYWTNEGKLQNNGIEVGFDANIIRTRDFNVTLGASLAHYANKILELPDGDYLTSVYGAEVLTAVNQPIGQLVGYRTNGVFATDAEATQAGLTMKASNGEMVAFKAGDVKFVDRDDNNIINDDDKFVIGNTNPDFFGEINAKIKYKRLDISLLFKYSYGNDVYNYLRSQIESGSTFYNQSATLVNRWITEGQQTTIPKSTYGDPKGNNRFSDRWIEDGSYIRLKTLEVAYELPVNKVKFLQGVTLWASANNLFTLTNYLGIDPEFSASNSIFYQGIDTGTLSQSRSFNVGFKVYL
ncbi:MAG: SusC/RagA family TonB-linked outer membrane protein [Paludibacteraceae bacterium]